ncbi:MAG: TMEM175 family protein [Chloroflexota bacterium]|nr:TMEM175 family protein [Chloroflexota bacterium]
MSTRPHDPVLERILFLTDGVFAIALTLLALELRLPVDPRGLTESQMLSALLETWPKLLGYATSFTVLSIFWVGNHQFAQLLRRADPPLVWLILLHLSFIAFLPFPTALIGERPDSVVASEFYCGSLLATMLTVIAITWYATWNHRLVAPDLDRKFIRYHRWSVISGVILLLLLMAVIPLGLPRIVTPLLLLYLLALGYIAVFMREHYAF